MIQLPTRRKINTVTLIGRLVSITMLATFLVSSRLQAQSLPQPVLLPPAVETPRDVSYPGTITLRVDATDVLRRIYQIHETIPVGHAGALTLLFPQWTPGDHAPNEPLEKLAGIVMTARGTRLHWVRDTIDVHAFHVDIPEGTSTLELQYQYLGSLDSSTGSVLITPTMLDLQWQTLVLYPAGYFTRDIMYAASITLPAGWTTLTSLDGGKTNGETITFPPISLDALVDQPVMAGRYLKQVVLSETPVPVRLDVAAQDPADLAGLPKVAAGFAPLIGQVDKEFGSHHYDHYDHMIFLSDEISTYFEHHRSGENVVPAHSFRSTEDVPMIPFVAHGYMHSWNGMYRRPAEMWTPNFNTPEQDSMLWVFEGLTDYLADVLCARAGMFTHADVEQIFTSLAAGTTLDSGAEWRTLQDTNNDPLISARKPLSWGSWQRTMFDPYEKGEVIWLEADTIIRQQSGGKRSLDDFAHAFFSGNDAGNVTSTYTFEDIVTALNNVQSYDWRGFLRSRLDDYGAGKLTHSIDRSGYRLVFTDKPLGNQPLGKSLGLTYSLGMRINAAGLITVVFWDSAAFKAKLTSGETIVQVNDQPYTPELLVKAIAEAVTGGPVKLLVKRGDWQQTANVDWRGGMRYPHLERIPNEPDLLAVILTPRK